MRKWVLAAVAATLVGCGGSPVEAVINEMTPPGDASGESAVADPDGGGHASDAGDAAHDVADPPDVSEAAVDASADALEEANVDAAADVEAGSPYVNACDAGECPVGTISCTNGAFYDCYPDPSMTTTCRMPLYGSSQTPVVCMAPHHSSGGVDIGGACQIIPGQNGSGGWAFCCPNSGADGCLCGT